MKKFSSTIAAVLLTLSIILPKIAASQSPDKMSYQAVVRNSADNVISNAPVGMQVSIVQGSPDGTIVYTETHTPETNANGLISIQIGGGPGFSDIDWGDGLYFVKTETDPSGGTNYSITSTSQLMSVPYALYAQTSGNSGATQINDLSDAKSDDDGSNDGSSVFLGVSAGTNDDGTDNKNVGIGYLALTSNTTGSQNIAVGRVALGNNTEGDLNTAIGSSALLLNTTGSANTATGFVSLLSNTEGENNTAIGAQTLSDNTTGNDNTAIGSTALDANTSGTQNTASGFGSLTSNTEGIYNTATGSTALALNEVGSYNTANGYFAGFNSLGDRNVFIGAFSGSNEIGSNTLYIENRNADADNALIYGEFGPDLTSTANVLRTNSEFQIGNPTGTGYAFPTTDGTANQVLQTNGNGSLSWGTASSQSINSLVDGKSDNDGTENGSSVFLGLYSGLNDNGTANGNAGLGFEALKTNTSGAANISIGYQALKFNTIGSFNSATGFRALYINSSGSENTATGYEALSGNTSGNQNTASGYRALVSNSSGSWNTANGYQALFTNGTGYSNVANGYYALHANTTGFYNTASGVNALRANISGIENTAIGHDALRFNTTGSNNIGVGHNAQVSSNTGSNQIRMGNTAISYAGIQVGWSVTSDKRWKENIRALPYGLSLVKQLKPVDYMRINNESQTREMGFIAQDVEELLVEIGYADQGFLTKDDNGYISLRYNDFIALLTKAIQEQQEIIENQNSDIESMNQRLIRMEALVNQFLVQESTTLQTSK